VPTHANSLHTLNAMCGKTGKNYQAKVNYREFLQQVLLQIIYHSCIRVNTLSRHTSEV